MSGHVFSYLLGFLLELLNGSLVDAAAFVDQVTGRGRFAGVDVPDDDDVDVKLFLAHCNANRLTVAECAHNTKLQGNEETKLAEMRHFATTL